ncbi:copper chaperone PCu(A)C [Agromyces atrinae]|uniref:Copper chaperone PCu(A)C n=1 Tax=Agromyces atrinae TaxID=592376 RepID=A0A4Q2MD97_9MICO|nr:copper chaperone PCu(A)C [Agromyces atrinae]NYD67783.1 hypothetical protein [Agromyces atrinae]RXZ88032.1 copper chaperone PCu(A)C [Agromyces atrinae]
MNARLRLTAALSGGILALALAGCSSPEPASVSTTTAAEAVTIDDAWVKTAESGMSAAFGEIENTGDADITVVSATSAASPMLELHETVENESGEMVMREKTGGFTIAAGEILELTPGGNHIMLMGLEAPVVAGDEVAFTLTFDDGSTFEFTAPAKDYSGANENYVGDGEMDMDMGGEGE